MIVFILVTALLSTILMTPIIRQMALNLNFVAVPRSNRLHEIPTPLMGGVALFLGLTLAFILLQITLSILSTSVNTPAQWSQFELSIIILVSTGMMLLGLLDDRITLPPRLKALAQIILIAIIPSITSTILQLPIPEFANFILTIFWFMLIINGFNFQDNMDGTASMISGIASLFFVVVATINQQFILAALAAAISGTSFGFLKANLFDNKQRIFMGDAGSLFLGFWLALLGLELSFSSPSPWITWPIPVLILGIPIFDTGLVFLSRLRRGQSIMQGGKDHLSHRLMRFGFGSYGVPFALGLINSIMGCVAIVIMQTDLETSLFVQLVLVLVGLYVLYRIELSQTLEFITGNISNDISNQS